MQWTTDEKRPVKRLVRTVNGVNEIVARVEYRPRKTDIKQNKKYHAYIYGTDKFGDFASESEGIKFVEELLK